MSKFTQYKTYIAIVETGGLSLAANTLNRSVSSVSKQLSSLESSLETKLVDRSTQSFAITALGHEFYLKCRQIVDAVESAEQSLRDEQGAIGGRLSLSFPEVLLNTRFMEILTDFSVQFPDIQFELKVSNYLDDTIRDRLDFCLRIGDLEDSRLTAIKLGSAKFLCCASPEYIMRNGQPGSPLDAINSHRFLVPSYINVTEKLNRIFSIDAQLPWDRVHSMDSEIAIYKAALQGMGISVLLDISIQHKLEKGELVNLFPKHHFPEQAIYLVFNKRDFMPKKMSTFKDYILENFRKTLTSIYES